MSLGQRLRSLREEREIYQKELAELLHVSVGTISNYETDTHLPDADKIRALADYFQVSSDYLLERTNIKETCDILGTPVADDYTVSDFVELLLDLTPADCKHILKFQNYMVYEHKRALFIAQKKKEREAAKKKNHNSNPLR